MKKTREKWAPDYVPVVGGLFVTIGLMSLNLRKNGKIDFAGTLCLTLVFVGVCLVSWWYHEKHPTRFQKMSEKRLRFNRHLLKVCSVVSLIILIIALCISISQL